MGSSRHRLFAAAGLAVAAICLLALGRQAFVLIDGDVERDHLAKTRSVLQISGSAVEAWAREHGRVPTTEEGLAVLGLKASPVKDAWGREVVYSASGPHDTKPFELYTVAPASSRNMRLSYWDPDIRQRAD